MCQLAMQEPFGNKRNQIGTRGALTVVISAEQKLAKHSRSWRCRRSAAEQRQLSVWWGLLFTDIRATPDQPQQVRQSHGAALIAVNVENVDPQVRLATTSLRTMSRPSCSALAKRRAVPGQSSTLARHRETLCEDYYNRSRRSCQAYSLLCWTKQRRRDFDVAGDAIIKAVTKLSPATRPNRLYAGCCAQPRSSPDNRPPCSTFECSPCQC